MKEYFKFWPSPESSRLSNLARIASFGVLLPFALVGLAVGASSARADVDLGEEPGKQTWPAAGLLYLFIVVFTLIHLLSWSLARYRLPVDAVLVIFASNGVSYLSKILGILSEHKPEHEPQPEPAL
jgi:hypothetical protein